MVGIEIDGQDRRAVDIILQATRRFPHQRTNVDSPSEFRTHEIGLLWGQPASQLANDMLLLVVVHTPVCLGRHDHRANQQFRLMVSAGGSRGEIAWRTAE